MAKKFPGKNIKLNSKGSDVLYIKQHLFALGFYPSNITKISSSIFRKDTLEAVKKYQKTYKLKVDGIIGANTWNSIEAQYDKKYPVKPVEKILITKKEFPNLTEKTITLLNKAWQNVSEDRINFMKLCLKHAYDTVNGTYKKGDHLVGMYVIGANLYNKKGQITVPTSSYIESRAKDKPDYFSGGRKEFMLKELKANPKINASDCSGMIIGCGWKLGLNKGGDATADSLSTKSSYSIAVDKSKMTPADWVAKPGHIGVFVGAEMVVEFAGGAYGCQLTNLNNRQCRNLMTGKLEGMSKWTRFRDPKWY